MLCGKDDVVERERFCLMCMYLILYMECKYEMENRSENTFNNARKSN